MSDPEKLPVESLLKNIEEILVQAQGRTIETLRPFSTRQPNDEEIFACFELFEGQDFALGYNSFYLRKQNDTNTLDPDWTMTSDGESLLPELANYMETNYLSFDMTDKDGAVYNERFPNMIFKWFSECWKEAGGQNSVVPTFFCFEKEYKCRDLATGEIMTETETAKRLGYQVDA